MGGRRRRRGLDARAGEACNRLRAPASGGVRGIESLQASRARASRAAAPAAREMGEGRLHAERDRRRSVPRRRRRSRLSPSCCTLVSTASAASMRALLDLARRALAPLLAEAGRRCAREACLAMTACCAARAVCSTTTPRSPRASARRSISSSSTSSRTRTRVQCEIVAALALDGHAGGAPGLFLVGDPKQSIYGWRSADLGAYERFVERVLAAGGRCRSAARRTTARRRRSSTRSSA